jgi:transposase
VCEHPKRAEIDQAHVAGASIRDLAQRFDRNKDTIQKHVTRHIPAAVQAAAATDRDIDAGDAILDKLRDLAKSAERILAKAEKKRDYRTAIAGIRELREQLELQARLLGELKDRQISITNVQLDGETAARMAEMFLARRQPKVIAARVSAGVQPPVTVEIIENEAAK